MTPAEMIRMFCYTIGVPAAAYIAITLHHEGARLWAYIFYAQSALWLWYMAEITMIGMGINTRDFRIIGTPMILVIAIATIAIARNLRRRRYIAPIILSHSKELTASEDAGAGLTPAKPLPEPD